MTNARYLVQSSFSCYQLTKVFVNNWCKLTALCFQKYSNSPCSPSWDAYSLDESQDKLEEEDEKEGHEVEGTIRSVKKTKRENKKTGKGLIAWSCNFPNQYSMKIIQKYIHWESTQYSISYNALYIVLHVKYAYAILILNIAIRGRHEPIFKILDKIWWSATFTTKIAKNLKKIYI